MPSAEDELLRLKQAVRSAARQRRDAVDRRDERSQAVWRQVMQLPELTAAQVVSIYIDFRSEVQTQRHLPELWSMGKTLAAPYCVAGHLGLFRFESFDELAPGAFGILEPRPELRRSPGKKVPPESLDVIFVPGLAFDPLGGRIGYGQGHYDRLLPCTSPHCTFVGLCFDAQLIEQAPTEPHDRPMHVVATESAVYRPGR